MKKSASYILSAYSFISALTNEQLLEVGYQSKDGNPIPSFDEKLLIDLCSDAQQIFENEKNILEIDGDFVIVGDIHGSFHDLLRILKFLEEKSTKVLFLGDYVDRGFFSLECITILFALKVMFPDMFYLIRGNHEFDSVCCKYGFKNEIINYHNPKKIVNTAVQHDNKDDEKFSENYDEQYNDLDCYKYSEALYNAFITVFSYLPLAAILNGTTFCIHGGLSPKLDHIDSINSLINRPVFNFEDSLLLTDLVWSDPSHNASCAYEENPRGRGCYFNRDSVIHFLKDSALVRMIRAHQCVKSGCHKNFGDQCITVFSASSYDCFMSNSSAILQLFQSDDSLKVTTFPALPRLLKNDAAYYKVQSINPNESKIHFCFSFLHPKTVSNVPPRMVSSNKVRKQIRVQKSENCFGSQSRITPLVQTKFITNPRRFQVQKSQMIYKPNVKAFCSLSDYDAPNKNEPSTGSPELLNNDSK